LASANPSAVTAGLGKRATVPSMSPRDGSVDVAALLLLRIRGARFDLRRGRHNGLAVLHALAGADRRIVRLVPEKRCGNRLAVRRGPRPGAETRLCGLKPRFDEQAEGSGAGQESGRHGHPCTVQRRGIPNDRRLGPNQLLCNVSYHLST
jgi:hypothetical protein